MEILNSMNRKFNKKKFNEITKEDQEEYKKGIHLDYNVGEGGIIHVGGGELKIHDWYDHGLPEFVKKADLLFVDPPWNLGNVSTFYTKARKDHIVTKFDDFYSVFFDHLAEINAKVAYVEIGKEYLADFIIKMREIYPKVTFYNSHYFGNKNNKCYVVRGSYKRTGLPKTLDYMEESDIVDWICENEEFDTIGDICMGQGLVAQKAIKYGRKFVGTELNPN